MIDATLPEFVWEISDDRGSFFSRSNELLYETKPDGRIDFDRPKPRLFSSRDKAEAWMQPHVEAYHKRYVAERAAYAGTEDGREEFNDEEVAWWQGNPPLTVERTNEQTWWGVGDGQWSDRDRRGASYAWLNRRGIVK